MKVWSVNSTQRATLSTSHSFEQNFYSYSEGLLAQFAQLVQFAQNHTDLFKIAQGRTDLFKIAQSRKDPYKITKSCTNMSKIAQSDTDLSQLYINRNFTQKSAT